MKLISNSFQHGERIPKQYAFCIHSPKDKVTFGKNLSPHLKWFDIPKNTKSFVLLCIDKDVPSKADDVNIEGKKIHISLPRVDFYHWILIDIPVSITELQEGIDSNAVLPKGKSEQNMPYGIRGINDYTNFFANNADLSGDYYGYDGPCPPWNDELIHHYYFTIYALDIPTLNLNGRFFGNEVKKAMVGHIIDYAEIMGTYTLNPDLL